MKNSIYSIWHPCSQMKTYEKFPPLKVVKAYGSYIELESGQKIIDAVSSWWCKSLGHSHKRLKIAAFDQMQQFEHVMLANISHQPIINLSNKLTSLILDKVFYTGDGSSAVEVALKMSIAYRKNTYSKRNKFITLKNGYYGESIGALSVSDVNLYKQNFNKLTFKSYPITSIPYVNCVDDPLWDDCSKCWDETESWLEKYSKTATAIIVEPIFQAAGGMRLYSKDFLYRLREWSIERDIHLICDEIMTGIGRLGKMFACEYASITPDFLLLSKGLTSGWMAFSAVLTTNKIYDAFYDDKKERGFLHSNTYSGHALSAAIACEVLSIIEDEGLLSRTIILANKMRSMMQNIADETKILKNIRGIGAVIAADIVSKDLNAGYEVFKCATQMGAYLRPLGNTIYWAPPLNIPISTLNDLGVITLNAIKNLT